MRHSIPIAQQFFVTAPDECPYLEGRSERKIFTRIDDVDAQLLSDELSLKGFRRSQNILYRPACSACKRCLSSRVLVNDFKPSKSQKRVLKRNHDLDRSRQESWATDEQYQLFRTYIDTRHDTGGMNDMDITEFAAMIEETAITSLIVEYYIMDEDNKKILIAACLTDVLKDGLSLVYSFFDTALATRSLGTYMILDHIKLAQKAGLPYVYLGYWVPGSPKMNYKAKFQPLEVYYNKAWCPVPDKDIFLQTTILPDEMEMQEHDDTDISIDFT